MVSTLMLIMMESLSRLIGSPTILDYICTGDTCEYPERDECSVMKLSDIKSQLRELLPVLRERYKIEGLEVFGSYVRGEQTEKSDVDLLVTFEAQYSLWQLIDAERFLRRKLRVKVDLVPKDSVKPALKDRILSEAAAV
jgi:predicted nucleotidyltransferase